MHHSVDGYLKQAQIAKDAGNLLAEVQSYRFALQNEPNHPEANFNMGVVAKKLGQEDEALSFFERAVNFAPNNLSFNKEFIKQLADTNQLIDAKIKLNNLLDRQGLSSVDFRSLDDYLHKLSCKYPKIPLKIIRKLKKLKDGRFFPELAKFTIFHLRHFPRHPLLEYNLGFALFSLGELEKAEGLLNNALKGDILNADHIITLARLKLKIEKFSEAEKIIADGLKIHPKNNEMLNTAGQCCLLIGKPDTAIKYFNAAISIEKTPASFNDCALAYEAKALFNEAIKCCLEGLKLSGAIDDRRLNHNAARLMLRTDWSLELVEKHIKKVINIYPDFVDAHITYATYLQRCGDVDRSRKYALERFYQTKNPTLFIIANFQLPIIIETKNEIEKERISFSQGAINLKKLDEAINLESSAVNIYPFYLAYQGRCNKNLLESLGESIGYHLGPVQKSKDAFYREKQSQEKIKIAFYSDFFIESHTIGKLNVGLLSKLDKKKFEVICYLPRKFYPNALTIELEKNGIICAPLNGGVAKYRAKILSDKLDILFFTDIGMSNASYLLAAQRLAPIQMMSWGHPDTSGLHTIDYFISSRFIEAENSERNYTEKLIKFDRLPCYYSPVYYSKAVGLSRSHFGLPAEKNLYGCMQSTWKFHPDFDDHLAEILEKDPSAVFVFVKNQIAGPDELLKQRWDQVGLKIEENSIFLPRMHLEQYMQTLQFMDVVLDPIHFGSGNTMYEALNLGLPIITWPGEFMRGRIVYGAYQQLQMSNAPIAYDIADYANVAVEWATNKELLKVFQSELEKKVKIQLNEDTKFITEFEDCIQKLMLRN